MDFLRNYWWLMLMIPVAVLGFLCKFVVPGYSFTALVCLLLILILAFYGLMPLVALRFPAFSRWCVRIVSGLLIAGTLVAAGTEAVIIAKSFGNPREEIQYMVVLGAKVNPDAPSASLQDRIDAAYTYLTQHPQVIAVVSGGMGRDEPMSEARCMYQHLVEMGIDPNRIWMEDQATSTWENLQLSLKLIEEKTGRRPQKLGVLSSEYHLFRASLFAKAAGVEFVGIPAPTSRFPQKINHFMREIAGIWHYIILGGRYYA